VRTPLRHLSAALLAWLSLAAQARAQLAVTATIESQYRVQGVSLTNGEPDGRIGLSYDHPSGLYGGASAIVGDTAGAGVRPLGYLGYFGFAKQTPSGLNWDVGITNSYITLYLPPVEADGYSPKTGKPAWNPAKYRFDYTDLYAGVSGRNLGAKLYLSPDHLGQGVTTAYVDLSAVVRPVSRLRLYVHAGALTPLSGGAGTFTREHFDFGPGAAWEFRHGELALTWSAANPRVDYPAGYPQARSALILSLTGSF
jgi:uncharacterized protein (TIGR02001 family)